MQWSSGVLGLQAAELKILIIFGTNIPDNLPSNNRLVS